MTLALTAWIQTDLARGQDDPLDVTDPTVAQHLVRSDNFNGPELSPIWNADHNSVVGRTHLNSHPLFLEEAGTTFVRLPLQTYDTTYPGTRFSGTELAGINYKKLGSGIYYKARVRIPKETPGLVCAFYVIGPPSSPTTDEIDIEFLTSQSSDHFLTTSWAKWRENPEVYNDGITHSNQMVVLPNFNRGEWNVFEISHLPDRIEWFVNGQLVRTETGVIPTKNMQVRFNIWAPASTWTEAYSAALQATANAADNETYYFDIDYMHVWSMDPPEIVRSVDLPVVASIGQGVSSLEITPETVIMSGVPIFYDHYFISGPVTARFFAADGPWHIHVYGNNIGGKLISPSTGHELELKLWQPNFGPADDYKTGAGAGNMGEYHGKPYPDPDDVSSWWWAQGEAATNISYVYVQDDMETDPTKYTKLAWSSGSQAITPTPSDSDSSPLVFRLGVDAANAEAADDYAENLTFDLVIE